jgi:hypothetical protein
LTQRKGGGERPSRLIVIDQYGSNEARLGMGRTLLPSSDRPERAIDHRPRAGTRDGRCCVLQYGQK